MKYFKNIFFASALVLAATSCVNDDVNYTTTDKPVVTVTAQSDSTVEEGGTITVSLETNKAYKDEMDFKLELVSGGDDSDYFVSDAAGKATGATSVDDGFGAFGYKIEMPAYASSTSFNITATKDNLKEGTETLRFKFTSADNANGRVLNDVQYINLTVTNFVKDEAVVSIDFDKTVTYKTIKRNIIETILDDETVNHTESVCGLTDFDLYVGTYSSETAACPEVLKTGATPLADGDYTITVVLWDINLNLDVATANGVNEVLDGDIALPFTLKVDHLGTFNTSLDFPSLYFTNSQYSNGNGNGAKVLGTLRVANGKYSLLDTNGNVVAAE